MGLLRVTGTIDVAQFWPHGESDADTTKILVEVSPNAFSFRAGASGPFKKTTVFKNATVVGRVRKAPIDAKGRLTIRLQGIDAPELHYRPTMASKPKPSDAQRTKFKSLNRNFRQPFGETATLKLAEFLSAIASDTSACIVETRVEQPTDVFDTYGRFVGDIYITREGQRIDVNRWLVEQGLAFPTFYTTMANDEIETLLAATTQGRGKSNRLWSRYTPDTRAFKAALVYRNKDATATADAGLAMMPKLFRRRATYYVQHGAGYTQGSFLKYVKSQDVANAFFLTDDFLANGVHSAQLQMLSTHLDSSGRFDLTPEKLVFREAKSKLIDAQGKEITAW